MQQKTDALFWVIVYEAIVTGGEATERFIRKDESR